MIKTLITITLILSLFCCSASYTLNQLQGKVVSLKNVKYQKWITHEGKLESTHPYSSDSKSLRFEIVKVEDNRFYFQSMSTNKQAGRDSSGWGQFDSNPRFEEYFKWQVNSDGHYIFNTSYTNYVLSALKDNSNTAYIYSKYHYNNNYSSDDYKSWELLVFDCPSGQVYKNDDSGTCVSSCSSDQYKGNYKCEACPHGCDKCNSASYCTSCDGGYIFQNDVCISLSSFTNNKRVSIKAQRGGKWCADEGSIIKCNRGGIGSWEKFTIERRLDGYVSLSSFLVGTRLLLYQSRQNLCWSS